MEKDGSTRVSSRPPQQDGFVMRSDTDNLMIQVRLDGFTANKLAPYATWETLRSQTLEMWQRYVRVASPMKVTRLAVRYTNRIEVPVGTDFKDHILTVPEIAPGIPQDLPEYFMRLVIPHPTGMTAIVSEASLPSTTGEEAAAAMLFDIDVFRMTDMAADDQNVIWSILEELRRYKNVIFFNSITPKQMESYK
jgi:uncharacterized protein (TIGR04255 family)